MWERFYKQLKVYFVMADKKTNMSKEEEVGYHKGSINTLANERNELVRLLQIVETLIQSHLKRLEELGVKITKKK